MNVEQLKNSILQLAIQGKLVEQREEEGTAEELYQQIQYEKNQLIKEGKLNNLKPLHQINLDELPFEIPASWRWVQLGDISKIISGTSYKKSDVKLSGIRIIRGGNVNDFKITTFDNDVFIDEDKIEKDKVLLENDFVVVSSTGSKKVIGKPAIVDKSMENSMIGAFLRICRFNFSNLLRFGSLVFQSEYYREHIRNLVQGTNINNIKNEYLTEFMMPLPPLSEQERIVDKIEELMPLIEEYGESYVKLEELNKSFPQDIKQSILQYAIQGKLVEQRDEEGSAEELYQQIQLEKNQLIKEGKLKKSKSLPPINPEEVPFDIPTSWRFVNLDDVTLVSSGYAFKSQNFKLKGIRVIRISDFNEIGFVDKNIVRHEYIQNLGQFEINFGDIIVCMTGGTVGKSLFVNNLKEKMYLNQRIARIACGKFLVSSYIDIFIKSPYVQLEVKTSVNSTNDNISMLTIKSLPVPLPPLKEQQRIVDKIEELLSITKALEGEIQ